MKAMILNGLGFLSAQLYLFDEFFVGKATEHLIGEGVLPSHLNDDRLGRELDKYYQIGTTKIFTTVAIKPTFRTLNWHRGKLRREKIKVSIKTDI